MALIVGITGGIGSGKSAVTDRFEHRGITVVDADLAARVMVEPGRPALQAIAEHFGAGHPADRRLRWTGRRCASAYFPTTASGAGWSNSPTH